MVVLHDGTVLKNPPIAEIASGPHPGLRAGTVAWRDLGVERHELVGAGAQREGGAPRAHLLSHLVRVRAGVSISIGGYYGTAKSGSTTYRLYNTIRASRCPGGLGGCRGRRSPGRVAPRVQLLVPLVQADRGDRGAADPDRYPARRVHVPGMADRDGELLRVLMP